MLEKVTNADSKVAACYYDLAGRKVAEVSPLNYDTEKSIDQMSRTEYAYDLMGRVKTRTEKYIDPQTAQWTTFVSKAYKYDNNGNVVKELDALGYESGTGSTVDEKINTGYGTEYTYNHANKALTVKDPVSKDRSLAYTVKYAYDALGRKISETAANGVITNYYDDAGNITYVKVKKTINDPEQTIQAKTYDYTEMFLVQ